MGIPTPRFPVTDTNNEEWVTVRVQCKRAIQCVDSLTVLRLKMKRVICESQSEDPNGLRYSLESRLQKVEQNDSK